MRSTFKGSFKISFWLTEECYGREVVADGGEGHEAPPEGVVEGPLLLVRPVTLNSEDQTGQIITFAMYSGRLVKVQGFP